MKRTSTLSLFVFFSLTWALPLPLEDCLPYTTRQRWLKEIFSATKNDHTSSTRLPNPRCLSHRKHPALLSPESHREVKEEIFNNAPLTPPPLQLPTIALSSMRPLHSSYLLSLSNLALSNPPQGEPMATESTGAMPSKPTSALPELRLEDMLRYWATMPTVPVAKTAGAPCAGYKAGVGGLGAAKPMVMVTEYSDLLIMGIVVLFLAVVVIVEFVECCWDLSAIRERSSRRDEIYLDDDMEKKTVCNEAFCVQPAPRKYKFALTPVSENSEISEDAEKAPYKDSDLSRSLV